MLYRERSSIFDRISRCSLHESVFTISGFLLLLFIGIWKALMTKMMADSYSWIPL